MEDLDRRILDLAGRHYHHAGSRLEAIRALDLTATEYHSRLLRLINNPVEVAAEHPEYGPLLNRLKRQLDRRLAQKTARRAA